MKGDPEAVGTQDATVIPSGFYQNGTHQQNRHKAATSPTTGTNRREPEEGWKQDAVTLTEEDYIRKHYYDKAETSNSGIPMDMYLGLCTGRLLSISLLLRFSYRRNGTECDVGISRSRRSHRRMDNAAPPHSAAEQLYEARK